MRSPFLIAAAFTLLITPTAPAERLNVLFIAVDDLRNDLGALGAKHARTPQLDAFAQTARVFTRHYTHVPTCGASRAALLRGRYPNRPVHLSNDAIKRTHAQWGAESLPAVFRGSGYRTLALGKITHYPGGLTGKEWAEGAEELPGAWERAWIPESPWKTPLAMMHGYANGVARKPGKSPTWEAFDGGDEAYPDAWVAKEAVATLKLLAQQEQPWFFSVGFFKPHLPFAAPKRWFDLHSEDQPDLPAEVAAKPTWNSAWSGSGEFRGNYGHPAGVNPTTDPEYGRTLRRAYAASVSYMDEQVGQVLRALREAGLEEKTIVIVWGDHGFLLGEHGVWGKHCLYEHALRSPLLIRHPGIPQPGAVSGATVETVDLFPTLTELCGIAAPQGLDGRSLRPQLKDPAAPTAKPAFGFWNNGSRTIRDDRWRLITAPSKEGAPAIAELFDYQSDPGETRNHAEAQPDVVRELLAALETAPAP